MLFSKCILHDFPAFALCFPTLSSKCPKRPFVALRFIFETALFQFCIQFIKLGQCFLTLKFKYTILETFFKHNVAICINCELDFRQAQNLLNRSNV